MKDCSRFKGKHNIILYDSQGLGASEKNNNYIIQQGGGN